MTDLSHVQDWVQFTATAEELASLARIVKTRQITILGSLQVGQTVEIVNVSPKYIVGTRATVIGRVAKGVRVRLADDADPRAFARFGREVTLKPTMIRLVESSN